MEDVLITQTFETYDVMIVHGSMPDGEGGTRDVMQVLPVPPMVKENGLQDDFANLYMTWASAYL